MEITCPVKKDLLSMLKDTSSCNFSLLCSEGKQVEAHRVILFARSPVFKRMIETDMKEKKEGKMDLKHIGVDLVTAMVHYMYAGEVENSVTEEYLIELLKLGHKYEIDNLVEDCSEKAVVSRANVFQLGSVAELYDAKVLLKKCAEFISNDMSVLDENDWNEELKESPKLLMNIVECLKRRDKDLKGTDVEISRFSSPPTYPIYPYFAGCQAITIELNRKADLVSVGLFGDATTALFDVRITVKETMSSAMIYSCETSFKSGGSIPVKAYVNAHLEPKTKYTVCVAPLNGPRYCYYGQGGQSEVIHPDGLMVFFSNSSDSTTGGTSVNSGQIPTLGFKIF